MTRKKIILTTAAISLSLAIAGTGYFLLKPDTISNENKKIITSISFQENKVILKDKNDTVISPKEASNILVKDNSYVTITAPTKNDEISISGTCSHGQIKIDVDKNTYPDGTVDLSLEGLTLSNSKDSPIYIASIGDICNISIQKDTQNTLEDGTNYTNADNGNGVIYSKDDLKIKGKGTLNINGNCDFGILSKNDVKIDNGTLNINSKGVSIKGKDSVTIGDKDDLNTKDAFDTLKLTLNSETSDGIRSTNPKDDTSKTAENKDYGDGKEGEITIYGGELHITSYRDALQSAGNCTVNGGTLQLYTYQGSEYSFPKNNQNKGRGFSGRGKNDFVTPVPTATSATETTETISAKGIKAEGNITIQNGSITADCSDDALHCGEHLTIQNGTLSLATGDDGIHADTDIVLNGGNIDINKSYEGIEAPTITINDGTVHVVASDDGFNASDGNSESASELYIKGGYCFVDAEGDSVDSNGNLHILGGTTIVAGPSLGGNGSFDYGDGGNYTFECTGGTLLAVGTNNMAVFPQNTDNYLTRNLSAEGENTIAITDKNNKVLSVLKFNKTAQLLTYFNHDTTASDCTVYLNPKYDGKLDAYGYGTSGTISGGSKLTEEGTTSFNGKQHPGSGFNHDSGSRPMPDSSFRPAPDSSFKPEPDSGFRPDPDSSFKPAPDSDFRSDTDTNPALASEQNT